MSPVGYAACDGTGFPDLKCCAPPAGDTLGMQLDEPDRTPDQSMLHDLLDDELPRAYANGSRLTRVWPGHRREPRGPASRRPSTTRKARIRWTARVPPIHVCPVSS